MKKRVGILTGGGDAPGLNGIIEATCRSLLIQDYEVVGVLDGFEGIFSLSTIEIQMKDLLGRHAEAGTLLGTSNKSRTEERQDEFLANVKKMGLQGLIVAGGDGTFSAFKPFVNKIPIIGVPKTIDNDLSGTEVTFGFDTACAVVAEATDALRTTAHAHQRVIVVEAMGRTAGWIALGGGLASYADAILIPERPFNKKDLLSFLQERRKYQRGLVMVVSEGAYPVGESPQVAFTVPGSVQPERFGGLAQNLARWIEAEIGWEARHVVLGHLQRARSPTTTDRFLTLSMGVEVAKMVMEKDWNKAVVYRNGKVLRAPITDLLMPARLVEPNHRWVNLAQSLEIFI